MLCNGIQKTFHVMGFGMQIHQKLIHTSEKHPPGLNIEDIAETAYRDYKVDKIFVKERFDPEQYRGLLAEMFGGRKREPAAYRLEADGRDRLEKPDTFRTDLKRLVAGAADWRDSDASGRRSVLREAGLPEAFVDGLAENLLNVESEISADLVTRDLLDSDLLIPFLASLIIRLKAPGESDAAYGAGKKEKSMKLTTADLNRLNEELLAWPAWASYGRKGMVSVLTSAGLPGDWVAGMNLDNPYIDTPIVLKDLEKLGWMKDRPTHKGLGALVEHLLEKTPRLGGSLFLSLLLSRYDLIREWQHKNPMKAYPSVLTDEEPGSASGATPGAPVFVPEEVSDWTRLEAMWSERGSFVDTVFLEQGALKARSVCRVEASAEKPIGTGFLVGENLVLTNHHVVPSDDTGKLQVRFGFRVDEKGRLEEGVVCRIARVIKRSKADRLDYALLEIEPGEPLDAEPLTPRAVQLDTMTPVYVVQHPLGMPQKIVLQDNWITYVAQDLHRCQYLATTAKASSGSPVFNESWELVALHHSGGPVPKPGDGSAAWGNEGIPMHAILPEIEAFLG